MLTWLIPPKRVKKAACDKTSSLPKDAVITPGTDGHTVHSATKNLEKVYNNQTCEPIPHKDDSWIFKSRCSYLTSFLDFCFTAVSLRLSFYPSFSE